MCCLEPETGGPWADEVFRSLPRDGHAAVVAAGQVDNGTDAVERYRRGAAERLGRVGIRAHQVPLLSRRDADGEPAMEALDGAAFVYVLGGGPARTVEALRGSRFWDEVLRTELPYVGSSGGAMVLGARYPASFAAFDTALAVFSDAVIGAHWNELEAMHPDDQAMFVEEAGDDIVVGLDVDTALVGDGNSWSVFGLRGVHIRRDGQWADYRHGDHFVAPLRPNAATRSVG